MLSKRYHSFVDSHPTPFKKYIKPFELMQKHCKTMKFNSVDFEAFKSNRVNKTKN